MKQQSIRAPGTRLLNWLLCLAMVLSLAPSARAAEEPAKSKNINRQDYSLWASTVKSYLYENQQGGLTRVEYIDGKIVVEDYDSAFTFQSSRTFSMELPIWGGFFAGSDYNFFIFGQDNEKENDNTEVFRIVKYSKDWQRLGQASLNGANTIHPFDAGSLRCDEYGGYLYIRTCHEMYASAKDGLNHQANVMIAVRQSNMTVSDAYYNVMNSDYGYVSHSFNQFILVDEDGRIMTLDHGDAYPRGVVWMGYYADAATGKFSGDPYSKWCFSSVLQEFAGRTGDNATGASVGGLAETADCYVMAYNYDGQGGGGDRSVYFQMALKANGEGKQYQITNDSGTAGTTPVLAPTGLDGGYMLWNSKSGGTVGDTLHYLAYTADGVPQETQTAVGNLSDCQPIYYRGQAVWYVTDDSAPVFYTLDASGVKAHPAGKTPAEPATPVTPDGPPTQSSPAPFTDVPPDSWYAPFVQTAYDARLIHGLSDGAYGPDNSLTLAEAVTFAARIYAGANNETVPSSGGSPWYKAAYDYCVSNSIINASAYPLSLMEQDATRLDLVTILDGAIPAERMDNSVEISRSAIPDLHEYSPAAGDVIYKWYCAGIISGNEDGGFGGSRNIKRSEVAKILCTINRLS